MKSVLFRRFTPNCEKIYEFDVPASKSILNRALLLAAFSKGDVVLHCGSFGEDTRAMIDCLTALGIKIKERAGSILICGAGTEIQNRCARLNVMSAGTCARFLPAVLGAIGGDYFFTSSEQMKNRPMEFLAELEKAGVEITYFEKRNAFPFRLVSKGFSRYDFTVNTDTSTQYASALLTAGAFAKKPLNVSLTGTRTEGSYINMTLSLLNAFHVAHTRNKDRIIVFGGKRLPEDLILKVEADLSAACYFYALALLFGIKILVRRVEKNSLQGDFRFLQLLSKRGVRFTDTDAGLLADGTGISSFVGFTENFCDFSDQTMTAAALAPFASTPTRLSGIGHIRKQECDRIHAIQKNLTALNVPCECGEDYIEILPAEPTGGIVETFRDHRIAMAFTLAALKTGDIEIDDTECADKTFSGYFDEIQKLFS